MNIADQTGQVGIGIDLINNDYSPDTVIGGPIHHPTGIHFDTSRCRYHTDCRLNTGQRRRSRSHEIRRPRSIDNADLFTKSEEALEAERRAYGEVSREAWIELLQQRPEYRFICDSEGSVHPVEEIAQGNLEDIVPEDTSSVILPIRIRGQRLGGIRLKKADHSSQWGADEMAIVENLTEQLSIALDSARLYETTQRQAEIERMASEMTGKIHRSLDMESLMKTLVQEISSALDIDEAFVQLGTPPEVSIDSDNGKNES